LQNIKGDIVTREEARTMVMMNLLDSEHGGISYIADNAILDVTEDLEAVETKALDRAYLEAKEAIRRYRQHIKFLQKQVKELKEELDLANKLLERR
jgi:type IV secretory pathway ATPase VirB11/archaellum biosynthesis ATPase